MNILVSALFAAALFGGVLICLKLGWRLGRKRWMAEGESIHAGLGAVEGAVYGLMGLLLAFTFTGAASRFNDRRELIIAEVNAVGTAWLRLDLLDDGAKRPLQDIFRRYLDSRIDCYRDVTDESVSHAALARTADIQNELWQAAIAVTKEDRSLPLTQILLPALNEMFDVAQQRALATRLHPHPAIFGMLGILVLTSGLMGGFAMAKAQHQSRMHVLGFALITSLSIYLILDFEYPRLGLIRVDTFDQALVELRQSMD